MNTHKKRLAFFSLVSTLCLVVPFLGFSQPKMLFRIGTGGETGVYYPIGKLIAQGLTKAAMDSDAIAGRENRLQDYIGVAQQSAGSGENLNAIVEGEIEAGLVQADVASLAYQSMGVFAGREHYKEIRAIASLYPEKFQIVTRKDANIRMMSDLKGKRISLDEQGSGTLSVMRIVLEAYGIQETDLQAVYLKPVFTHNQMVQGDLQGFVMMAGVPMQAFLDLADIGISLVPIERKIADAIHHRYPFLVPGRIEAGAYPGIVETETIQVHALLTVNAAMDDALAYQVTSALWSAYTLSLLREGHAQGKAISLATALSGVSIPLHEGAKRFYREKNMLGAMEAEHK